MEIIKEERPENEIEYIDSIELAPSLIWTTIPSNGDKLTILGKIKPKNLIEITEEITILGLERPQNITENIDSIELKSSHEWITQPNSGDKLIILGKSKPKNIIEIIEEINILGEERPENKKEILLIFKEKKKKKIKLNILMNYS